MSGSGRNSVSSTKCARYKVAKARARMQQVNTTKGGLVAAKPLKFEQHADIVSRKVWVFQR